MCARYNRSGKHLTLIYSFTKKKLNQIPFFNLAHSFSWSGRRSIWITSNFDWFTQSNAVLTSMKQNYTGDSELCKFLVFLQKKFNFPVSGMFTLETKTQESCTKNGCNLICTKSSLTFKAAVSDARVWSLSGQRISLFHFRINKRVP